MNKVKVINKMKVKVERKFDKMNVERKFYHNETNKSENPNLNCCFE